MAKPRPIYGAWDTALARSLWRAGVLPPAGIAARVGISVNYLYAYARAHGWPRGDYNAAAPRGQAVPTRWRCDCGQRADGARCAGCGAAPPFATTASA